MSYDCFDDVRVVLKEFINQVLHELSAALDIWYSGCQSHYSLSCLPLILFSPIILYLLPLPPSPLPLSYVIRSHFLAVFPSLLHYQFLTSGSSSMSPRYISFNPSVPPFAPLSPNCIPSLPSPSLLYLFRSFLASLPILSLTSTPFTPSFFPTFASLPTRHSELYIFHSYSPPLPSPTFISPPPLSHSSSPSSLSPVSQSHVPSPSPPKYLPLYLPLIFI